MNSATKLLTKEKPILEQKPEYKLEQKLFLSAEENRQGEGGLRTKGWFKKSYEDKPLISVVTVVFNGEKHLEQTIKSVIEQSYDNVEYIVIDGGSTDGTLELIKKYGDQIDYWVSEPDGGIYDAMNKGASLCSGEYVAFLNADDWYNVDTLETVINVLNEENVDFIYGNADVYENDNFLYTLNTNIKGYRVFMPFCHQTLFVKISYILEIPFNIKYGVIADHDFAISLMERGFSYQNTDLVLVNFRIGGVSSEGKHYYEHFIMMKKHYGFFSAIHYHLLRRNNKYVLIILNGISKVSKLIRNR